MIALIVGLCLVNIVLWIIFLIRFKKLFSTDKIIENTSEKMNKLVSDIDKTTKRDLFLSSEATKRMQGLLDDADAKMELFKEATQRLREMIAEADKLSRRIPSQSPIYQDVEEVHVKYPSNGNQQSNKQRNPARRNIDSYLNNSVKLDNSKNKITPDTAYEVVKTSEQAELFDEDSSASAVHDSPMQVTQEGAAFKEVPLIITKVYEEIPQNNEGKSKKNLSKQVQELYNNGKSVEEIANELSCSRTEVQLIIDMYS